MLLNKYKMTNLLACQSEFGLFNSCLFERMFHHVNMSFVMYLTDRILMFLIVLVIVEYLEWRVRRTAIIDI